MSERTSDDALVSRGGYPAPAYQSHPQPATLADILERVLDKGIIIAGDIRVNLLDIELLTVKIRLIVVSVDKAEEMGIDWWRHDPMLTVRERGLAEENDELRQRVEELESGGGSSSGGSRGGGQRSRRSSGGG
jgi:hypothetical protein